MEVDEVDGIQIFGCTIIMEETVVKSEVQVGG
jgi:hypothetical protein